MFPQEAQEPQPFCLLCFLEIRQLRHMPITQMGFMGFGKMQAPPPPPPPAMNIWEVHLGLQARCGWYSY